MLALIKQTIINVPSTNLVFFKTNTTCVFHHGSYSAIDGEVKQRQHFVITETPCAIQSQVM